MFSKYACDKSARVHRYVFAGKPVVVSMSANLFFIRVQYY